jgi:hypothetical protein
MRIRRKVKLATEKNFPGGDCQAAAVAEQDKTVSDWDKTRAH